MGVRARRSYRPRGILQDLYGNDKTNRSDIGVLRQYDRSSDWIEIGSGSGAPAYQNSWVAYGGGIVDNAGFMRDAAGIVHLRGLMKNGTIGNPAFTLPVGFRPLLQKVCAVDASLAHGRVDIYPNGNVQVAAAGATTYVSFDGLCFPAEQ